MVCREGNQGQNPGAQPTLILRGYQPETGSAWATDFMPNAAKLSMVTADDSGSLSVFIFDINVGLGLGFMDKEGKAVCFVLLLKDSHGTRRYYCAPSSSSV
jgi:hypothetical protein